MPLILDNQTAAQNVKFEVEADEIHTFTPTNLTGDILIQHYNGSSGVAFSLVSADDDAVYSQAVRGGANVVINSADIPALIEGPFRGRIVYAGQGSAASLLQDWFS